ncbi:MAG TPA: hypothetical protein VF661_03750 [Actinomycetales bacterium]|jgi:hypothetical protein
MSTQDRRPTGDNGAREQFAALLVGAVRPTLVMATLTVAVGAFFGAQAAWSAAIGALLVLVFFSLSLLVMRQTAHLEPTVVMAVVLATYTGKIIALGVAMFTLRGASWMDGRALGLAVIACTVVWLAFEMRAFTRLRVLVSPGAEQGPA